MLTHQASLKAVRNQFVKNLHQNVLLPISLVAVSNKPQLILVNCKKCILNFSDAFNSWLCNLLL